MWVSNAVRPSALNTGEGDPVTEEGATVCQERNPIQMVFREWCN